MMVCHVDPRATPTGSKLELGRYPARSDPCEQHRIPDGYQAQIPARADRDLWLLIPCLSAGLNRRLLVRRIRGNVSNETAYSMDSSRS